MVPNCTSRGARSLSTGPAQDGGPSYFTRPVLPLAEPVTRITGIADLDALMDSAECSCNAGDDNPHQPVITGNKRSGLGGVRVGARAARGRRVALAPCTCCGTGFTL